MPKSQRKNKRLTSNLNWVWLSLMIIMLDQCTKYFVMNKLMLSETIPLLPFLNVTLVYNQGAAFGFLHQAGGWQQILFIGIALLVSTFILAWLNRLQKNYWLLSVALALILGGALGNLWDRIYLGYVVDFIDLYIKQWHWPAFNIADAAICIGAVILVLEIFQREKKHSKRKKIA